LTKTDPKKEDTDGNGTTDDKEDLDNDGLTNKEEVNGETEDGTEFPDKDGNRPTDPLKPDTDGDQINDGEEVKNGTDPTDPSDPGQPPVGDGYTLAEPAPTTVEGIEEDGTKNAITPDEGTTLIPPTESVSGLNVDEDGNLTGTPTVDDWGPNEEERTITIVVGIDIDGDGAEDETAQVPVIIQRDTDGDKTPDVTDTDDDNDGLTDDQENELTKTDPKKKDTDGDGTTDDEEDLDNDGLTNKEEVNGKTEDGKDFPDKDGNRPTDPLKPDTDGDQINDGEEVKNGTDPTDPNDPAKEDDASKYNPVGQTVEVNKGEDPKAEDGIANKDDLPKGTKYEWETKVDTSKPGDQSATVVVTYPDGSSDTVKVTVTVKKDSTTTPGTTPGTKPIETPKLKIVLVDGEGNHIHETATFKLNDKIVSALSRTVKTDENGKATIAALTDGEYELTQIVTPDGYATLEQPIKIKVSGRHIWIDGTLSFDNTVYVVNQKKGAAAEPTSPVERVDGLDRAEVAANLAKRFFGDADKVILVQSGAYADAMSALNVSQGRYPILYTKQLGLYGVTLQALQELKPNEIILVGGPKTIDPAVAESLKTLTEKVTRVDGHDRFEVNANSALYLPKDVTRAVFASGMIYTDALSSAPLAGQQKAPLLLVREGNVPKEVKAYLQAHASITEGTIVGGPVTVGAAAKAEIESLLGKSVSRISGADRFEVSANVARKLAPADMALVTSGMNWSDALVAGPVAQKENAPILLTRPETLPGSVAAYLKEAQSPEKVLVIGGPNSVSENVLNTLRQLRKGAVESVNTTLDPAA
ncbi:MAG: cell wall-binding repeat-containing protein, partial [Peptoniphilaceae bacterium]|nr:cell wall-binding repeat-containing protein [Peptoniphilaceae bacterium]